MRVTLLFEMKMLLERSIAFSPDVLHVLAGAALAIVAALVLRSPLSSWRPWTVTLLAAVANEAMDFAIERWPSIGMQAGESVRDLLLTLSVPTLLLVGVRTMPHLFVRADTDARASTETHEQS